MTKMVLITWKDHYSQSGWFEPVDINTIGHVNMSVGFLIQEEDEEYISIAQTKYLQGDTLADVLHILKKDIMTIETLDSEGLYYENTTD